MVKIEKLANGIKIERDYFANVAIVWSPDGDYDAVYTLTDKAGIANEVKFIAEHLGLIA